MSAAESGKYLVAVTGDINRFGCFVKTTTPFPIGDPVSLKMTYDGRTLAIPGRVVYVQPTEGMGIAFDAIAASDQAILDRWLVEMKDR